jgi:hypothetical protein
MSGTRDLLEIYVADVDGVVWTRRLGRDGRSWSSWESLNTSAKLGPVVAVAAYSGSSGWRELYAIGSNGRVAHRWRQDGHPWHDWYVTDRDDAHDIALTSALKGMLECFIVSRDGDVWHRWYIDGKWSAWGSLGRPAGRSAAKYVAVMSGQERHQEVFSLDTEGNLAHRWHWQGDAWSEWSGFPVPEQVSDVAAVATSPGRLNVIAIGGSGALWQRTYRRESNWSDWERIR